MWRQVFGVACQGIRALYDATKQARLADSVADSVVSLSGLEKTGFDTKQQEICPRSVSVSFPSKVLGLPQRYPLETD
jgi:hypothetical protein